MPSNKNFHSYKRPLNIYIFNEMIAEERAYNGLSQEDMGKLLNVSNKVISSYEKKKNIPSIQTIFLFLKVFSKSISIKDRFGDEYEYELPKFSENNIQSKEYQTNN